MRWKPNPAGADYGCELGIETIGDPGRRGMEDGEGEPEIREVDEVVGEGRRKTE